MPFRLCCSSAFLSGLGLAIAAILSIAAWTVTALATERISGDNGGQIGSYLTRYSALRKSSERVVIDGKCASACTLVVNMVPRNHICVTSRAVLAFHAAWSPSLYGAQLNMPGTRYLWSHYPSDVRYWIARHGGLRSETIYLSGRELAAMFTPCR